MVLEIVLQQRAHNTTVIVKDFFVTSNLNVPLQLETIFLCPITQTLLKSLSPSFLQPQGEQNLLFMLPM